MRFKHCADAHSVLEYLISKAMLEGKLGKAVVNIPMTDLINEYEGIQFEPESAEIVLRVTMKTEWEELEESLEELEEDINLEETVEDLEEEEEENGEAQKRTRKNKTSQ